jgi:hypothetical protein
VRTRKSWRHTCCSVHTGGAGASGSHAVLSTRLGASARHRCALSSCVLERFSYTPILQLQITYQHRQFTPSTHKPLSGICAVAIAVMSIRQAGHLCSRQRTLSSAACAHSVLQCIWKPPTRAVWSFSEELARRHSMAATPWPAGQSTAGTGGNILYTANCSGWRQLRQHAQPCMQGSGDAACLFCMLGAVYFVAQVLH